MGKEKGIDLQLVMYKNILSTNFHVSECNKDHQ